MENTVPSFQFEVDVPLTSGAFSVENGALSRARCPIQCNERPCSVCLQPGILFSARRWRPEKLQNRRVPVFCILIEGGDALRVGAKAARADAAAKTSDAESIRCGWTARCLLKREFLGRFPSQKISSSQSSAPSIDSSRGNSPIQLSGFSPTPLIHPAFLLPT